MPRAARPEPGARQVRAAAVCWPVVPDPSLPTPCRGARPRRLPPEAGPRGPRARSPGPRRGRSADRSGSAPRRSLSGSEVFTRCSKRSSVTARDGDQGRPRALRADRAVRPRRAGVARAGPCHPAGGAARRPSPTRSAAAVRRWPRRRRRGRARFREPPVPIDVHDCPVRNVSASCAKMRGGRSSPLSRSTVRAASYATRRNSTASPSAIA
jgi:hypothetical protein